MRCGDWMMHGNRTSMNGNNEMNALHTTSERRHIESITVSKPKSTSISNIATERISSIDIKLVGHALYTAYTTVDIESVKKRNKAARCIWNDTLKSWNLFEPVGQLESCVIRIKRA
jgi:hypothetical protein